MNHRSFHDFLPMVSIDFLVMRIFIHPDFSPSILGPSFSFFVEASAPPSSSSAASGSGSGSTFADASVSGSAPNPSCKGRVWWAKGAAARAVS